MEDLRAEVIRHYSKRGMTEDYWNRIISTDPDEVARIYAEVQKELEERKRIGKRPHFQTEDGFIFYETYYLDEHEPPASKSE